MAFFDAVCFFVSGTTASFVTKAIFCPKSFIYQNSLPFSSATPLRKQKFDIGCTIYRRVVISHPAVLEDKKSASKAPFCLIF